MSFAVSNSNKITKWITMLKILPNYMGATRYSKNYCAHKAIVSIWSLAVAGTTGGKCEIVKICLVFYVQHANQSF